MKKEDKIIAVAGIVLIVILAVVAIVLLFNSNVYKSGLVNVVPETETVELQEEPMEVVVVDIEDDTTENITSESVETVQDENKVETNVNKDKTQLSEKYVKPALKQVKNDDTQLKELAAYWEEYRLDAVDDLIHLERIRMYTNDLAGTNQFYYCGEVNSENQPDGRGLAIYSDNTYYYGDWAKGLRHGSGMWLRIYPDDPGCEGQYTGIIEHQYNGDFKNDLPNGEGQEHYTFGEVEIDSFKTEIFTNVVGGFKNGYYDGDMYMMTLQYSNQQYDWYAKAKAGSFQVCDPNKISNSNKKPVWQKGNDNNHEEDENDEGYYWMSDSHNKNFGIYGLKK